MLISLHSWQFGCVKERGGFAELVNELDAAQFMLSPQGKHNALYEKGYVGLPHFLRQGVKTFSLYLSPLLPYNPFRKSSRKPLITCKAKHYTYQRVELEKVGVQSVMVNVSYAVAIHLGQMLTVASKQVAQAIFKRKRQFY